MAGAWHPNPGPSRPSFFLTRKPSGCLEAPPTTPGSSAGGAGTRRGVPCAPAYLLHPASPFVSPRVQYFIPGGRRLRRRQPRPCLRLGARKDADGESQARSPGPWGQPQPAARARGCLQPRRQAGWGAPSPLTLPSAGALSFAVSPCPSGCLRVTPPHPAEARLL